MSTARARVAAGADGGLHDGRHDEGGGAPAGDPPAALAGGRLIRAGPLALIEVSGEPSELGERLGALRGGAGSGSARPTAEPARTAQAGRTRRTFGHAWRSPAGS